MSLSALYFGHVLHHRLLPRVHRFRYGVMALLLDLDQVDALHRHLRLFAHNRFNLYAFYDRDHGNGTNTDLKTQIQQQLAHQGIHLDNGKIILLCYPRILGFVFNPLSVYYCYDAKASLRAILYEVSNTFGERHSYLLPVSNSAQVMHEVDKCFYVSPFMPLDCRYRFRMQAPDNRIGVHIEQHHADSLMFRASFSGVRRPLNDRSLLQACFRYPLMTLKVVAGIHWEALRLWCKGLRIQPKPAPPSHSLTLACVPNSTATHTTATGTKKRNDGENAHETH
uniref:DUF1365 domain-containing protein n=1 Tax=Marinobacterium profundum TaxID=1714300 RepID=UPI0009E8A584|nr:DUF1365 domain-containing protein [Marinobacterium profundum]